MPGARVESHGNCCVGGSASFPQWEESELTQLCSESRIRGVNVDSDLKALSASHLLSLLQEFDSHKVTDPNMAGRSSAFSKAVTAHSSVGKCEGRYQGRGLKEHCWTLLHQ